MPKRRNEFLDIQVGLSVTWNDLQTLQELGERLAREGPGRIVTDVSPELAVDLAVNFIVSGNLHTARQSMDLPDEGEA